jgi:two-component system chemotaxis response regulator CheY
MVLRAVELSGIPIRCVHECSDGEESLELLQRERVDLALVDLHLPVMDGVQVVEAMMRDPSLADVPIVVITAERNEARVAYLKRLGVRAVISKPFKPEEVRSVILEIFSLPRVPLQPTETRSP